MAVSTLLRPLALTGALAAGAAAAAADVRVDITALDPINETGASSLPSDFVEFGGKRYFSASDWAHGRELWVSAGGASQTQLLKDIAPGQTGSAPDYLTRVNTADGERLFFTASDADGDRELWVSDGTASGTHRLKDINPDDSSRPYNLTALGDTLYFGAETETGGYELWRSDGTEAGTELVKDINPGVDPSTPSRLTVSDDRLYFAADDGNNGQELWISDGTEGGTTLLHDPNTTDASRHLLEMVGDGAGGLFFQAINGDEDDVLYYTDGSTATELYHGSEPRRPEELTYWPDEGKLVFSARGTDGREPWISDGSLANTEVLDDIATEGAHSNPAEFTPLGADLYFVADDDTSGEELWHSDGGSPTRVEDIRGGSESSAPRSLRVFNDRLWFTADDGDHGRELWTHDPDAGTTALFEDINEGAGSAFSTGSDLTVSPGNWLMFSAYATDTGREPWYSNGNSAGTHLLKDINDGQAGINVRSHHVHPLADGLLVDTHDGVHGREPWYLPVDGQPALLKDINPGEVDSRMGWSTVLNGHLYFSAEDGDGDIELWHSDSTRAGTEELKDIRPNGPSQPTDLVTLGDHFLFSARGPDKGTELWRSDGTAEGTELLADLDSQHSGDPEHLARVRDQVLFQANDNELWRSDGTGAGTIRVATLGTATTLEGFTAVGDAAVVFSANDGDDAELWISDLTEAGTERLKDIRPGAESADPRDFFRMTDGRVLFTADDGVHGRELWITDGTAGDTKMVANLDGDDTASYPSSLLEHDGQVYFSAYASLEELELELYRLNPADLTVSAVTDTRPGRQNIQGDHIERVGEWLMFAAKDADLDSAQIWLSDGSQAGTRVVSDLDHNEISAPVLLHSQGNRLYFSAETEARGRELWRAEVREVQTDSGGGSDGGSGGGGSLGWPLLALIAITLVARRRR